jgi:hypothetical protein
MPGSEASLNLIFEVNGDEAPHASHELIVLGARKMQIWKTVEALPLINAALSENEYSEVTSDDCVLRLIRVGSSPLIDYDLGFCVRTLPHLVFVVTHRGTRPHQVRVDSGCDLSYSGEVT